ncbi:porin family protein [Photobacterium sanguinicancri]|uniref:porin family protein n=1 Tax=Photobacterium sanguinicancri TaxID=875932 RepID=UPI0021C459B3|nr:porin family protein [Photobacterium sanguinicancri]
MKKFTLIALSTLFLSNAVLADDYAGHRLGAGYQGGKLSLDSSAKQSTKLSDSESAKIEYGYDFNRIFSLNAGGTVGRGHSELSGEKEKFNKSSLFAEAELGYAFEVGNFDIKPYAALGVSANFDDIKLDKADGKNHTAAGVHAAVGARLNTPVGVYVDGRVQNGKVKDRHIEETQGTITVGYKF